MVHIVLTFRNKSKEPQIEKKIVCRGNKAFIYQSFEITVDSNAKFKYCFVIENCFQAIWYKVLARKNIPSICRTKLYKLKAL